MYTVESVTKWTPESPIRVMNGSGVSGTKCRNYCQLLKEKGLMTIVQWQRVIIRD